MENEKLEKGLQWNMGKTKVMRCKNGESQVENTGKFPCGIGKKRDGAKSIRCIACNSQTHKKYNRLRGDYKMYLGRRKSVLL